MTDKHSTQKEVYHRILAQVNGEDDEMEKEERLSAFEIIELAKLVGTELGSLFSGTLDHVYQDDKISIKVGKGLGVFTRVHIEYLYKGSWTPVFDYSGPITKLTRFRYGRWVDILEKLAEKAERRIEEREDVFFGDLDED